MKTRPSLLLAFFLVTMTAPHLRSGTWTDHFTTALSSEWISNTNDFELKNGVLIGRSISPLAPAPFNVLEINQSTSNYIVSCWIKIVSPNLAVCTKGTLLLRHNGNEGYVFALHEPTQTLEIYRLSNGEMLFSKPYPVKYKQWYWVRATAEGASLSFEVNNILEGQITDSKSGFGKVGVAVQDAGEVQFDDFRVTGPAIKGNVDDQTQPFIKGVTATSTKLNFSFATEAGYDYFVQKGSSLFSPEWQTITNFRAKLVGFDAVATDNLGNQPAYYRVEKAPCLCD